MDVSAVVAVEGDYAAGPRTAPNAQGRTGPDAAPDGRRDDSALGRNVQLARLAAALCAIAHAPVRLSATCVSVASVRPGFGSGASQCIAERIRQCVDQHRLR